MLTANITSFEHLKEPIANKLAKILNTHRDWKRKEKKSKSVFT